MGVEKYLLVRLCIYFSSDYSVVINQLLGKILLLNEISLLDVVPFPSGGIQAMLRDFSRKECPLIKTSPFPNFLTSFYPMCHDLQTNP